MNLRDMVQRAYESKVQELNRLREEKEEKESLINLLPAQLVDSDINWYTFYKKNKDVWYLETNCLGSEKADQFTQLLKVLGVQNLKSKYKKYNNSWYYTGSFRVADYLVEVMVDGGSKPPACRVEEIKELKEVVTYKAICEETGEEVSV